METQVHKKAKSYALETTSSYFHVLWLSKEKSEFFFIFVEYTFN